VGAVGALAVAAAVVVWLSRPPERATPSVHRVTADASAVTVPWGDAEITLEPGGAIVATGDASRGVVVVIERGAAQFAVAPRAGRPRYAVVAGDVEVEVVGTQFRVERQGDTARVDVREGVVTVRRGGEEHRVEAGAQWPVVEARAPEPAPAPVPAPEIEPEVEVDPVPAPKPSPPRRAQQPPPAPPTPPAGPSTADRYAEAARLEARDADAAATIYTELAARDDSWGATALYALAELETHRGHIAAAKRHLKAYLKRFPRGVNAGDARARLDRL
jgi:hypothetical protein